MMPIDIVLANARKSIKLMCHLILEQYQLFYIHHQQWNCGTCGVWYFFYVDNVYRAMNGQYCISKPRINMNKLSINMVIKILAFASF